MEIAKNPRSVGSAHLGLLGEVEIAIEKVEMEALLVWGVVGEEEQISAGVESELCFKGGAGEGESDVAPVAKKGGDGTAVGVVGAGVVS